METSALACLGNIFVDPKKALADIRGHNAWLWYPLLIALVVSAAFLVWYYLTVDFDWLVGQILNAKSASMSPEQMDAARHSMTKNSFLIFGTLGAMIVLLVVYAVQALYFFLVSKLAGYEVEGYGSWFSFTAWTSFPNVLGYVAAAIAYGLAAGRQVNPYASDISSLNTLLFHLPMGSKWFALANSVHLTTFWMLGLMIIGFHMWTKRSLGKSAMVVLAPYAVIYGLIIAIKLA